MICVVRFSLTVFVCSVLFHGAAFALPNEVMLTSLTQQPGMAYDFSSTVSEVAASPTWDPSSGEPPPVSIEEALQLAEISVAARSARFERFEAVGIALQRIRRPDLENVWFYLIRYLVFEEGVGQLGQDHPAVVLMTGQVVEPSISVGESVAVPRRPSGGG